MSGVTMADIRTRLARIAELHHALLDLIDGDLEPSLGEGGQWTDAGLQYDLETDYYDKEASLGWGAGTEQTTLQTPDCGVMDGEQDVGDMAEEEYGA